MCIKYYLGNNEISLSQLLQVTINSWLTSAAQQIAQYCSLIWLFSEWRWKPRQSKKENNLLVMLDLSESTVLMLSCDPDPSNAVTFIYLWSSKIIKMLLPRLQPSQDVQSHSNISGYKRSQQHLNQLQRLRQLLSFCLGTISLAFPRDPTWTDDFFSTSSKKYNEFKLFQTKGKVTLPEPSQNTPHQVASFSSGTHRSGNSRERQTALRMQEIQINSFNFTHEQTGRLMSKTLHCASALGSDFKGWCHAEHSAQTARCYKNTGKVTFLTENKISNRTKIRAESLKLITVTFSRN